MLESLLLKVVEMVLGSVLEKRDEEKLRVHHENEMLSARARLTSSDELVLSWIERRTVLTLEELTEKFPFDCMAKRVALLAALGFVTVRDNIVELAEEYKPLARDIADNSVDQTIVLDSSTDQQ
jgi:hypothetical protein